MKAYKFDRMGSFIYSDEEGTQSYELTDKVDRETATERQSRLMALQQDISLQKNLSLIGEQIPVIIDDYDNKNGIYIARSCGDAPEIDNEIIIEAEKENVSSGNIVTVEITDASEYELYGNIIKMDL